MGWALVKCVRYGVDFIAQAWRLLNRSVMEENPTLETVIAAVVSHIQRNHGYVTKTKLLKLLYLFDVDYYRIHQKTFTGFNWIYYHLGPWTKEYYAVLDNMINRDTLIQRTGSNPDNDTLMYRTSEDIEVFKLFPNSQDEKTLRSILVAWRDRPTSEILDYVYFHTEPMQHGTRNQPLDFSVIKEEKPAFYRLPSSGNTPEQIQARRQEYEKRRASRTIPKSAVNATPDIYDDVYYDAMAIMDNSED